MSSPSISISFPGPATSAGLPVVPVDSNCKIEAYGTASNGTLTAVFATVLPGHVPVTSLPPNPFGTGAVQGFISDCGSGRQWCFVERSGDNRKVPHAQGNGNEDTLVVWATFQGSASIIREHRYFIGSGGSGCSGSGGSGAKMLQQQVAAGGTKRGRIKNKAPLAYRLAIDLGSLDLPDPLGDLLGGAAPDGGGIELRFDPQHSAAHALVWRGQSSGRSLPDGWTLEVSNGQPRRLTAILTWQRWSDREVLAPIVWQSELWDLDLHNVLLPDPEDPLGECLPTLFAEPV